MRIARAIEERRGDVDDADVRALGQEALGLLDALIERRITSQVSARKRLACVRRRLLRGYLRESTGLERR